MDTMADRFARAMKLRELTPADLVDRKVMSKANVYFWLDGTGKPGKVRADTVAKVCKALQVRRDWLLYGKGPIEGPEETEEDWSDVQGYAQAVGLGDGAEGQEYAETHKLKFRADSLRRKGLRPESLAVMYGKGDSMLPRIRTGDAILFDQNDKRPQDETLFVIICAGVNGNEYSVKQCRDFGGQWFFEALNPHGDHGWRKPRPMLDKRNPIEILGRVRWIGSWEG